MARIGRLLALGVFNAGWLVPATLGVRATLAAIRTLENPSQTNSFPFSSFAGQCFTVAGAWLSVVIIFWTVRYGMRQMK